MTSPPPRPTFRITLEARPSDSWLAPAERRLARLLKTTLRAYGFRAVAVEDVTPAAQPNPEPAGDFI